VFGNYRFDPPAGVHVVLPAPGSACTINFTFDVVKMPSLDRQAAVPGVQTAQIASATTQSDGGTLAGGQGSTTPVTLIQATPTIVTDASADIVLGAGQLSDQASVTGVVNPTGPQTVTFKLYGPGDVSCVAAPVFTSTMALSAGAAQSTSFTPTAAGTYRWVATYNGDANNAVVSGACGDATEVSAVAPATPSIVTLASPGIVIGSGQLSDQATVTGVVNPTGPQTVTFRLFGPTDAACASAPVFTSTVALTGGSAQSAAFTPTTAGTYRWVATYDGDVNNVSVSGTCGDPTETRVVAQATPTIVTQASPDIVIGSGQLSDRATVSGVVNPIGPQTVTFRLYGPNNATCAGPPAFTSTVTLAGGEAQSALFTPTTAGTFRWIATYDGDANNIPAAGSCGDPTETRAVTVPPASLPPSASPPAALAPTGAGLDRLVEWASDMVLIGALLMTTTRRRIA
jgi:hypothetical protein